MLVPSQLVVCRIKIHFHMISLV